LAPSLLRVESANALWKYQRAGLIDIDALQARHAELCLLVHRFVDEQELFPEALQLAADFDHPVYDAVYAVAARRNAATLLSFDRRLLGLCQRAGIACALVGS
jgi:predicted nucleic acid-binding protein